jgi:hypothetical protein
LQCVLFDGNTKDVNLIGIEYIVSGRLLDQMPQEEKSYWHPHNFELLSGQLVAPGLPEAQRRRSSSCWSTPTARPGTPGTPAPTKTRAWTCRTAIPS